MHAVSQNVKLYDKVLENVRKCCDSNRNLDVSAAYLINKTNDQMEDIKGLLNFRNAGCKLLRLFFRSLEAELNDEICLVETIMTPQRKNLRNS